MLAVRQAFLSKHRSRLIFFIKAADTLFSQEIKRV